MDQFFGESVFRCLQRRRVRYLVAGGVAVNLHGVPRLTRDIDIMVDFDPDNVLSLVAGMRELGFRTLVPLPPEDLAVAEKREDWARTKGAVVFTFVDSSPPHLHLDVFLRQPVDFEAAWGRRQQAEAAGITLPVVSLEDLVRMKELAGRLQDQADVAMLRKVRNERLDG